MKGLELLRSNFSGNCCFSNELFKDHFLCQNICVKSVQHTTQMLPKAAKLDGLSTGEQADRRMEQQSNKAMTGAKPGHLSVWIELLAEHGSVCILDFNQISTVTMVKHSNGQVDLHKLIFPE